MPGALLSLAGAEPGERFRYGLRVFINGVVLQPEQGGDAVAAPLTAPITTAH